MTGISNIPAGAADLARLEEKVDNIADALNNLAEAVGKLPTKSDLVETLERMYSLATLKAEHERMKTIIREQLHVEV